MGSGYHGVQADLQVTAQYEADDPDASKYTVTFLDWDDSVLKTMLVAPGKDAEPPIDPKREGYTFIGWRPAVTNIQANTTIYAQYEKNDSEDSKFTVRFIDYDDTVLYVQKVASGEDAIAPQSPTRSGYTFTGWRPAITGITKDTDTYAQYAITGSQDDPNATATPAPGTTATPAPGTNTTTKLYTLTVKNGSGSGSYAAGSQPIIIANDPAKGMQFSNWTIDPSNTTIASKVLSATVITMPAGNVTIEADFSEAVKQLPFKDVSKTDWYYEAAKYVYDEGMMSGTADDLFSPNISTTRGMIVTILYRLEKEPTVSNSSFSDVSENAYYAKAVAWAATENIVGGYGDGKFGPEDPITREQLAAILYRYAQYKGTNNSNTADLSVFTDAASISEYAEDAMRFAVGNGIMNGNGDGTINPTGTATRAEAAQMLMNFLK